jgi:hypothetical protein
MNKTPRPHDEPSNDARRLQLLLPKLCALCGRHSLWTANHRRARRESEE